MDKEITFAKKGGFRISSTCGLLILIGFFGCIAATGFLVYYFAPCSETVTNYHYQERVINETSVYVTESEVTVETTTHPVTQVDRKTDVRLPRSVHPQTYDLSIVPFLDAGNFSFKGEVVIVVNVTEATRNITLHANELSIDESLVKVSTQDNETVDVSRFENDTDLQFFILHFDEKLSEGEYKVYISFAGLLNDALQGFYRSSYKKNNETRWLAATQFQPTDARRAFPCFDEPALKANFKISIGRPTKLNAISNMPLQNTTPMDHVPGYVWDHFQQSVPMSTYLVAFVVSDFKSRSKGPVSLWAREDAIDQTMYSLEIAPQVLKYYEQFFNISFPLPKIDMIALPDFSAGAMENWGLITYRESNLLYEDGVSSRRNKQSIAIVIAHELAHQWFGNLVTPSWWTDLWLNEGFASYLEYVGVDAVNPDWKMLDQFVIYELQLVFALDALKSSHQISIEVNNPDEINDIFDRISYAKGATIIRMMEHFMTTKVFKKGLTNYLNEKTYGHAQQDDLWKFLTDEAHAEGVLDSSMSVKEIMDTWTLQTGFPIVNVIRNYEDNTVNLKQERFLINISETDNSGSHWWIPVTFIDTNDKFGKVWMTGDSTNHFQVNTSSADWLLFNVNQTGYYRVNYDANNWKMITAQLTRKGGFRKFDPKNRAQIVDDALNLANAGYLNYTVALDITTYLEQEKEYVPWKAALKGLDYIYEMFLRSGHFDRYKDYLLSLITPFYFEVGYRDYSTDPLLMTYNRFEILSRACKLGHLDCISNAARLFQNWKAAPEPDKYNPISPNLKNIVYCTAISGGGEEEWRFAWQRYLKANVGTERDLLLAALACTRESWLLNKYLDMAMTQGSGIRKQDASTVFAAVARNIVGQPLAFKYITSNWNKIRKYMGSNLMSLNSIIRSVTLNFNSEQELDDLKHFVSRRSKDLSVASRSINQAIEQTTANVEWMNMNFDNILAWLENRR